MQPPRKAPRFGEILILWAPLSLTWLMMSLEGPFLAAVIARLPDPKLNLAAFGVGFAFAILVEAPVIMILSASTALVAGRGSFRKLRSFTHALDAAITVGMLLLLLTPAFEVVASRWIGLSTEVTQLTHRALLLLLPWPAAIGYRRFYQGLMIRQGHTRRVAYGTLVRLCGMSLTALVLFQATRFPGAWVGALALTIGVSGEALATRWMARPAIRAVCEATDPQDSPPLTHRRILSFYTPLAMTSVISLAAQPMVTFFMGQARLSLESLAVLPVVNSLTFIFRSSGLSFQEVAIALLDRPRALWPVTRFAAMLGLGATGTLALIAWTPLAGLWYGSVSGLGDELTALAIPPTRILAALPALSVLLSLQRAILVHGRRTAPIIWATLAEVFGIAVVLLWTLRGLGLVGVMGAALAYIAGRLASNALLVPPCLAVIGARTDR